MATGWPLPREGRLRCCTKNVTVYWGWIRLTSYVGLNAGIVYNSDPTSRISNYILICIQPNIWRLSGEYISTSVCRNIRIYLRQTPFGQKISSYSGTLQKSTIKPAEHRGFSLMKRVPFIYSWKISDSKAYQTGRVDKAWGNWKRRGGGRCSEAALKALL